MGGYGSDAEDRVELTRIAIRRGERLLGESISRVRTWPWSATRPWTSPPRKGARSVSVAVASGKYDLDDLREHNPDHLLASLEEPFPRT